MVCAGSVHLCRVQLLQVDVLNFSVQTVTRKERSCNALEVMNWVLIMTVNTIAYRSAHVTRHLMRASEE